MPPARRKSAPAPLPGSSPLPDVRLLAARPDAALLALPSRRADDDAVRALGQAGDLDLDAVLLAETAKGEPGEVVSAPDVLLFGVGAAAPKDLRKAGAALARKAKGSPQLVVDLDGLQPGSDAAGAFVEGLLLASYRFTLKPGAEPRVLQDVVLVGADPVAVLQAVVVARATALARDLVNLPPRECSPEFLAKTAATRCADLAVRVRDDAELRAEGFGGVVAVGQGSSRPPRFVEIGYDGSAGGPPRATSSSSARASPSTPAACRSSRRRACRR